MDEKISEFYKGQGASKLRKDLTKDIVIDAMLILSGVLWIIPSIIKEYATSQNIVTTLVFSGVSNIIVIGAIVCVIIRLVYNVYSLNDLNKRIKEIEKH